MSEQKKERDVVISVAAEQAGMHAQTLRQYDRLGLVTPIRARGGGRRYSQRDVELLREIQHMSQEEGINLAGIKRILGLVSKVEELEDTIDELREELHRERQRRHRGGALVHVPRSQAVVVWNPERRKNN